MKWFSATEKPVIVSGLLDDFCRLPSAIAGKLNENAARMSRNSAGGRVRFSTNSENIVVRLKLENTCEIGKLPISCIAGTDLYINDAFFASGAP